MSNPQSKIVQYCGAIHLRICQTLQYLVGLCPVVREWSIRVRVHAIPQNVERDLEVPDVPNIIRPRVSAVSSTIFGHNGGFPDSVRSCSGLHAMVVRLDAEDVVAVKQTLSFLMDLFARKLWGAFPWQNVRAFANLSGSPAKVHKKAVYNVSDLCWWLEQAEGYIVVRVSEYADEIHLSGLCFRRTSCAQEND